MNEVQVQLIAFECTNCDEVQNLRTTKLAEVVGTRQLTVAERLTKVETQVDIVSGLILALVGALIYSWYKKRISH